MKNSFFTLLITLFITNFTFAQEQIDLFILSGQSNAVGAKGDANYYPEDPNGLDEQIRFNYTHIDPFFTSNGWTTMGIQISKKFRQGNFGPEVTFARSLKEAGYNPAVFKYAEGGSSIFEDWKTPGEGAKYDQMVVDLKKAIKELEDQGHTVNIRCFIWIQGESDAEPVWSDLFEEKLLSIITDMRSVVGNDELPVLLGVDEQIYHVVDYPAVLNAQEDIALNDPNIRFTSMYGFEKADYTHLSPAGLIDHGVRLFDNYQLLVSGEIPYDECSIESAGIDVLPEEKATWGQSFKADCSGNLTELTFNAATNLNSPLTVSIHNGANCEATQLYSQPIANLVDGVNIFTLDEPLYIDTEHTYYVNITSDSGETWQVRYNDSDEVIGNLRTYTDGENTNLCSDNLENYDLEFTVSINEPAILNEFTFFDAEADYKNIKVNWTVSNEIGNKGYYLERSNDGSEWTDIQGLIAPTGGKDITTDYTYSDTVEESGEVYYRVRQVNTDNSVVYSSVIFVNYLIPNEFVSIKSIINDESIDVKWTVSNEINHQGYSIEKSIDGSSWSEIGTENNIGTQGEITDYLFNDESPEVGDNYFRVKHLDAENEVHYSEVTTVNYSLPNEFTAYNLSLERESVKVSWTVANEINNEGFNIERSTDQKSWEVLGFVNAKGAQASSYDYIYEDNSPKVGVGYYRIKQIDTDGSVKYTDVKSINYVVPNEFVSFEAVSITDGIRLNWIVANEINNEGFYIEESIDESSWTELVFIDGKGGANTEETYTYLDTELISGDNHYRIKQVTVDGYVKYSDVETVNYIIPNQIVSFDGSVNNTSVTISWKIENQSNILGFSVEKSLDQESWSEISFVDSKSGTNVSYSYNDNAPVVGHNYYRLKQESNSGKENYSEVLNISYAIPNEYVGFEAEVNYNIINVSWTVANEVDNNGFYLERSSDGNNWTDITFVTSKGGANINQDYTYADENPLNGQNYYRVRQESQNGSTKYSDIVNLDFIAPNDMFSFTAEVNDEQIDLQWSVNNEINNKGFYIERSKDGADWKVLDFKEGVGSQNTIKNYDFIDDAPIVGDNHYRIKQETTDGRVEYTKTVVINYVIPNEFVAFKGEVNSFSVDLSWSVNNEINNDGYSIEKSVDGSYWTEIAQQSAKNKGASELENYTYQDEEPFIGFNYYRIKQTDTDTSIKYTRVIIVEYSLPNEIVSFDTEVEGKSVAINWSVSNELDNKGFAIEKSIDGSTWEEIDFVNSKGNPNTIREYSYYDASPVVGDNYYRLKQVSENGDSNYSKLSIVNYVIPNEFVAFKGKVDYETIKLNWSVDNETNNKGFAVERSIDNESWEELTFITGKGDVGVIADYNYSDINPVVGDNFYRIKQVNTDGTFDYSDLVTLNYTLPNEISLFASTGKKDYVILSWKVLNERENKGFSVQKSEDQLSWETVQFIDSKGDTNASNDYIYKDETPNVGINYYRLKVETLNGSTVYSDIIFEEYALPNEMSLFSGETVFNYISLQWYVSNERENKGFSIEKSNDGAQWEELKFITGKGSANIITEYNFNDANPFIGDNFYRLKQVNDDNTFAYSNVIVVSFSPPNEFKNFEGTVNDESIDLSWRVFNEVNNDRFYVEKSSDGQNWESIGLRKGKGGPDQTAIYDYNDDEPFVGDNYYRVKQQDLNRNVNYTEVIVINYAIPNEVLSFEGEVVKKSVVVNWSVANEVNNEGFAIEKSTDGVEWNEIDFINPKGAPRTTVSYVYSDNDPLVGDNYYRLKQLDLDKSIKFTEPIIINYAIPNEFKAYKVEVDYKKVNVSWTVSNEVENKGFSIEKSLNSADWEEIQFVEGQGSPRTNKSYLFEDLTPTVGDNYYRIKQLDEDGGFQYTEIAAVTYVKPNEITKFEGNISRRRVSLTWAIQNEMNNKGFVIERSNNGSSNWKQLGEIEAENINQTTSTAYFFDDNAPVLGFNYYRLKQIDIYNEIEYSEVLSIAYIGRLVDVKETVEQEEIDNIANVYPIPSDGIVNIDLNGLKNATVNIFNLSGELVYNESEITKVKHEMHLEYLSKGVYLITIHTNDHYEYRKLILK